MKVKGGKRRVNVTIMSETERFYVGSQFEKDSIEPIYDRLEIDKLIRCIGIKRIRNIRF